jgi:L-fucose isomerase-like protein
MGIWKAIFEGVAEEKFPSPILVLFVSKFSPNTNETCKNRREIKIWVILSTEK